MRTLVLAAIVCFAAFPVHAEIQPSDADYGPPPSELLTAAKGLIGSTLKDPYSANYTISETYRGFCNKGFLAGKGLDWVGWAANIAVNAKNSYGAYTGIRFVTVLFRGDEAVRLLDGENFGALGPSKGLLALDGGAGVCKRANPKAPARLGIAYNVVPNGFVVERVEPDSVASRGGLKRRMIITEVDGVGIAGLSAEQVQRMMVIADRDILLVTEKGEKVLLKITL